MPVSKNSVKKSSKKIAGKKTSNKVVVKKKKVTNSEPKKVIQKHGDRTHAKEAGLPVSHFRVLRSLKETKSKVGLTYREIEKRTGYYSNLPNILRDGKDGTLCTLGLAKENSSANGINGRSVLSFAITAKGCKSV